MIVDDEERGRKALEWALINQDYRLEFASSGAEAIARASISQPDLILLDVMMPGMDGYTVCRRLRADPKLAEVPIIIVTALDDQGSLLNGLDAGADDYISKPFNFSELRARIHNMTSLNRYRKLLNERAQLHWLVDRSTNGYVTTNLDGKIEYLNATARLMLGIQPQEDLSQATFLEIARRNYHCQPADRWREYFNVKHPGDVENLYLVQPESERRTACWLEISFYVPPGVHNKRLIQLQDITEKVNREREVQKFHTVLAHKLRTPLVPIYSGMEMLANDLKSFSEEEIKQILTMARESASRLKQSIEEILDYIQTSTIAREGEGFKIEGIKEILAEISQQIMLAPEVLEIDPDLVGQETVLSKQGVEMILLELFQNAQKFHPDHRPNVKMHLSLHEGRAVRLLAIDDGLSLSPAALNRVLWPYEQFEKSTSGEVKGMGLGLPIAASLIWETGGNFLVYNRKDGPGMVIDIIIPLKL